MTSKFQHGSGRSFGETASLKSAGLVDFIHHFQEHHGGLCPCYNILKLSPHEVPLMRGFSLSSLEAFKWLAEYPLLQQQFEHSFQPWLVCHSCASVHRNRLSSYR